MKYIKNITGTNAYRNDEKGKLTATINQVSAATVVWKFSVAEFQ